MHSKRLILFFLSVLFFCACFLNVSAQDKIILKNGYDTVLCKILQDKIRFIEYRLYNSDDTTTYKLFAEQIEGYMIESNLTDGEAKVKADSAEKSGNTNDLKIGFYLNYSEFINNKPSVNTEIRLFYVYDAPLYVSEISLCDLMLKCGSRSLFCINSGYWGYCDGNMQYKKIWDGLFSMNVYAVNKVGNHYMVNYIRTHINYLWLFLPSSYFNISRFYYSKFHRYIISNETGNKKMFNLRNLKAMNLELNDELWYEYDKFRNRDKNMGHDADYYIEYQEYWSDVKVRNRFFKNEFTR